MLSELSIRKGASTAPHAALAVHALHIIRAAPMDWFAREMDGVETIRTIRPYQRHAGVRLPIVALTTNAPTANTMSGDRERGLADGMDDLLSTPVQLHELSGMLNKWCPPSVKETRHDPMSEETCR